MDGEEKKGIERSTFSELLLEKIPLLLLSTATAVGAFFAAGSVGAVGSSEIYPVGARFVNAIVAYGTYIWKTFWPVDLAIFYPYRNDPPLASVIGAGLLVSGVLILALLAVRERPYILVGWLWFLGVLVPMIGFVQAGAQGMADRYSYVSLIGVFIIICWGGFSLFSKTTVGRRALGFAGVVGLAGLAVATTEQIGYWKDSVTLFERAIAVTRDNALAHNNLGSAFAAERRHEKAAMHFSEAVRIRPDYARAHLNLGITLGRLNRLGEAQLHFEEALRLDSRSPLVYYHLGDLLVERGILEAGIARYTQALDLWPNYPDAHAKLGVALERMGRPREAISHYQDAVRLDPKAVTARLNLGSVLIKENMPDSAIIHLQEALRIRPDSPEAHHTLSVALNQVGRKEEALFHCLEALKLKPEMVAEVIEFGSLLGEHGHGELAISFYKRVLELRPALHTARFSLARAYLEEGQRDAAVAQYELLKGRDPDLAERLLERIEGDER